MRVSDLHREARRHAVPVLAELLLATLVPGVERGTIRGNGRRSGRHGFFLGKEPLRQAGSATVMSASNAARRYAAGSSLCRSSSTSAPVAVAALTGVSGLAVTI